MSNELEPEDELYSIHYRASILETIRHHLERPWGKWGLDKQIGSEQIQLNKNKMLLIFETKRRMRGGGLIKIAREGD